RDYDTVPSQTSPLMPASPRFPSVFVYIVLLPAPRSTLFPYTTLFRSDASEAVRLRSPLSTVPAGIIVPTFPQRSPPRQARSREADRKSTRLNSSHQIISYAVFCLKKKKQQHRQNTNAKKHMRDETTTK